MNIDRTRSKSSFSQQNQGIVKWDFGERKYEYLTKGKY